LDRNGKIFLSNFEIDVHDDNFPHDFYTSAIRTLKDDFEAFKTVLSGIIFLDP